jgi:quercetin dioxygenase-like cupin family protein
MWRERADGENRFMTANRETVPGETFATRAAFTDPATQPVLRFLGSLEHLLVAGPQSGGEFALFEATGERGHTSPRHRHRLASETFIVLDGELLIEAGDERRVAAAGHVAVLPRDQVHTFLVVSATARYLTLHTPAGFDGFVHEVAHAAQHAGAVPGRAGLVALAAEHGIDIVGPGLTLDDYQPASG